MGKFKSQYPPNIPEIKSGIVPLWHSGYYDGPLSGYCMYRDSPHYFDLKHEYVGKISRRKVFRTYWLYKLTPEQWEFELYWHNEFRLHVGTHCDYNWDEGALRYSRTTGSACTSMAYTKEMYYDRVDRAQKENNVSVSNTLDRHNQVVGWAIYDVVFGKPWYEWRPPKTPRKKKAKNVAGEKEGT